MKLLHNWIFEKKKWKKLNGNEHKHLINIPIDEFEFDRPKPNRRGGDELPLSFRLLYFWLDVGSNSCVKPHENTNDDNEWKCDRRTIACTTSDNDQLWGPLVKRCKIQTIFHSIELIPLHF